jgi:hypothetical protein
MAYEGVVSKIPLGEVGLLTDVAADKVIPSALINAKNICFSKGTVEKAPGTIQWNATALSAGIVATHYWQPNLDMERFIAVTSDGNIYKGRDRQFGSAINSTITSVLTPNCVFSEGGAETAGRGKKLFLFTNGATLPQVLSGDGTAFTSIARPNSDWTSTGTYPKFGVVHRNRLWAFAGQFSYASDSGDQENFQTANLTEAVYPGEGGELRGGFVYKTKLFAFKDGGFVYALNDEDTSETNWFWQKIGSNFGLAAPNACAEVLDDLVAGNTSGTINSFAATQKLGSVEAGDIIQQMQFETYLRGNTSKSGVPFQHLLYYAEKKILFATYRSAYYTYNDMLIAIDFGRLNMARPSLWIKGYPQCLALYKDANQINRPMYGDKDGFLHLMDAEDRVEGSTAYTGAFQIPHIDFSHENPRYSSMEKHFDFLAVHYIPEGSGDLSCDYYIDGRFRGTITFPMVQYKKPQLGTLTLGTDRLAQPTAETSIRKLTGTGRTFSAYFYNSGSNQSFQIPAISVFFRPGSEKAMQV